MQGMVNYKKLFNNARRRPKLHTKMELVTFSPAPLAHKLNIIRKCADGALVTVCSAPTERNA